MNNRQMYDLAVNAVKEATGTTGETPADLEVLWIGGVMEIHRAVVWFQGKLFMVAYNASTEQTTVDTYVKQE